VAPFRCSEHVPLVKTSSQNLWTRYLAFHVSKLSQTLRLFQRRTFSVLLLAFPAKYVSKLRHKNFDFRHPGTRYLHRLIDCDNSTKVHTSEIRAGLLATGQRVVSEFGCAICKDTFFVPARGISSHHHNHKTMPAKTCNVSRSKVTCKDDKTR